MGPFCYLCSVFVMLFVCSLQPCSYLLGKGYHLGSFVCDDCLCFVTFSCGVVGQVLYLIVSISSLCLLIYF